MCVSSLIKHLRPEMESTALNCMPKVVSDVLAPNTSGPRDVPRCGALSLLSKEPHYRGGPAETAARLNVKMWVLVTETDDCLVASCR
jgi:hypothetical protein